jgi:hypothetical protein
MINQKSERRSAIHHSLDTHTRSFFITSSTLIMNWFFQGLHEINQRHERLKNFVHNGMRYPLPPWGQKVMGCAYFTIPIIGGYYIMQWAISKAPKELQMDQHGIQKGEVYGNTRIVQGGQEQRVGAGGWGGGVKLAVNDAETQERSSKSLKRYMRQLKRERQKQQQEKPSSSLPPSADTVQKEA